MSKRSRCDAALESVSSNKIVKTRKEESYVLNALKCVNKNINGDVKNVSINLNMRGK